MTMQPVNTDNVSRIVMLTYGTMNHGGPYWCYVAVRPGRFDEFQAAMESGAYNMQDFVDDGYGEVIVSGEGVTPPREVTLKVSELFNVPVKEFFRDTEPQKLIMSKIQSISFSQPNAGQ